MKKTLGACLALIIIVALALPAFADVLVTKDGERINVDDVRIEGQRIYFTTGGAEKSLRLSDVDLDESDRVVVREVEDHISKTVDDAIESVDVGAIVAQAMAAVEAVDVEGIVAQAMESVDEAEIEKSVAAAMAAVEGVDFEGIVAEAMESVDQAEIEKNVAMAMESAAAAIEDAEISETVANAVDQALSGMSDAFSVLNQLGDKMEDLEKRFDLETEAGMKAAAGDLEKMSKWIRNQATDASQQSKEILEEVANEIGDMARLAKEDPAAAVRKHRN